jgi:SAM-dependent methyltransferase
VSAQPEVCAAVAASYESPAWRATGDGLMRPGGLALTDRLVGISGLPAGSIVWDIGCGMGTAAGHLSDRYGFKVTGIEPSSGLVVEASRRFSDVRFVVGRADALPGADGALDALLAECTWSVCGAAGAEDPRGAHVLAEFARVVRPGGWLLLSDLYALGEGAPGAPGRLRSEEEIRSLVTASGYAIERWEDRTADLRVFAARMTWEHGSLAKFLGSASGLPDDVAGFAAVRPGYYLLAARRLD